ncbi:MAG: 30S ribosomal protein S4 [Candidatus Marsarchaeota archaeon]|nr:30S ribosomal protein S4 [Candidatus Marsarchaeota archaeon]
MGDPRRIRSRWEGPKNPWLTDDLHEGIRLIGEYGLRNKRELYRAESIARRYRKMARSTLALTEAERAHVEKDLVERLYAKGLLKYKESTSDAILSLTAKDVLDRRLETIVYRKGFASTPHMARQMVVHRHITIDGRVVDVPGYLVSSAEEEKVSIRASSPLYKKIQDKAASQAADAQ